MSLHTADLHYGGDLVLHTASSGSVDRLEALYLRVVEDGHVGIGEVRINIAYLNGLAPAQVVADARLAVAAIDWRQGAMRLLATAPDWLAGFSAPVRMLIDSALQDVRARIAGTSVAAVCGASSGPRVAQAAAQTAMQMAAPMAAQNAVARGVSWRSNQTLFWSSDEAMLARAAGYVARGFHELKLRVGIGAFDDDLRRIDLLRARHGDAVTLSVDANGQWAPHSAPARLRALAERGVEYVEQPIAAGDWQALAHLLDDAPLIVMLDESLQSSADIGRLCALAGAPVAAHLKLVKLGGIAATIDAARRLQAVGIPLMIGQMNEGAAATAAALHVCCATAPRWAELYGADGLCDDPVSGLSYGVGTVQVDDPRGLGVDFSSALTQTLSL
ncbi:MAG: mandelate racemase/muconate lactonizing enzyme family protein [Janthinobacterium lividum]